MDARGRSWGSRRSASGRSGRDGVVTGAPVDATAAEPLDLAVMLEWGALARVDRDYRAVLAAAVHEQRTGGAVRVAG